jgi:hypothetical protein
MTSNLGNLVDDGAYAHATVGFAPLLGALTGMSSKGITVHEANLEEDQVRFSKIGEINIRSHLVDFLGFSDFVISWKMQLILLKLISSGNQLITLLVSIT